MRRSTQPRYFPSLTPNCLTHEQLISVKTHTDTHAENEALTLAYLGKLWLEIVLLIFYLFQWNKQYAEGTSDSGPLPLLITSARKFVSRCAMDLSNLITIKDKHVEMMQFQGHFHTMFCCV